MMAKVSKIIYILLLVYNVILSTSGNSCVQKSPCLCEFSDYSRIDLSNLIKGKEAEKYFLVDEQDSVKYYFHGCQDGQFNSSEFGVPNGTVIHTTLIYVNSTTDKNVTKMEAVPIGSSTQINFNSMKDISNHYELIFKNGTNVTASVHLTCDSTVEKPFFKVVNIDSNLKQFALVSANACIITEHPGMSAGSVLMIILIVFAMAYLIVGGLLLYFVRGARGVELIPNVDFWRSLPGLVKDGLIFLFSGCSHHSIQTPETYDRI